MNIFRRKKVIDSTKLENKVVSKYDKPGYHPPDLADSVAWHEHILANLKTKAAEAEKQLQDYKQGLFNAEMAKRAADKRPSGPVNPIQAAYFFPTDDEKMKRLQLARDQSLSDVIGMQSKIQRLKTALAKLGPVRL